MEGMPLLLIQKVFLDEPNRGKTVTERVLRALLIQAPEWGKQVLY